MLGWDDKDLSAAPAADRSDKEPSGRPGHDTPPAIEENTDTRTDGCASRQIS